MNTSGDSTLMLVVAVLKLMTVMEVMAMMTMMAVLVLARQAYISYAHFNQDRRPICYQLATKVYKPGPLKLISH